MYFDGKREDGNKCERIKRRCIINRDGNIS